MDKPKWPFGGEIVAATPLKVLHIGKVLRRFLLNHGCTIEVVDWQKDFLTYPEGSTRRELFPRTIDIRYQVLLPDSIELREVEPRGHIVNIPMVSVIVDARSQPELEAYLAQFSEKEDLSPHI